MTPEHIDKLPTSVINSGQMGIRVTSDEQRDRLIALHESARAELGKDTTLHRAIWWAIEQTTEGNGLD